MRDVLLGGTPSEIRIFRPGRAKFRDWESDFSSPNIAPTLGLKSLKIIFSRKSSPSAPSLLGVNCRIPSPRPLRELTPDSFNGSMKRKTF